MNTHSFCRSSIASSVAGTSDSGFDNNDMVDSPTRNKHSINDMDCHDVTIQSTTTKSRSSDVSSKAQAIEGVTRHASPYLQPNEPSGPGQIQFTNAYAMLNKSAGDNLFQHQQQNMSRESSLSPNAASPRNPKRTKKNFPTSTSPVKIEETFNYERLAIFCSEEWMFYCPYCCACVTPKYMNTFNINTGTQRRVRRRVKGLQW